MKLTEAINKLKMGIQEGDDDLIEEGFFLLTGENITFPEEEDDPTMFRGGKIRDLLFRNDKSDKPTTPVLLAQGVEDFTMNKGKKKPERKVFTNKFNPEIEPDKEEGAHLINDNVTPTPRTRGEFQMAKVHCQDCNKTIEVNPQFKKEPYNCDLIKCGQPCPNFK